MTPDTCVHFRNHAEVLVTRLSDARHTIRIAVCWFSHKAIFDVLLSRLRAGVRVALALEYDTQNIRTDGIDFQKFIRAGGHFFAHRDAGLMHHKFAIVDDSLLLTGSFNWTYSTNSENMIVTNDPAMITAFGEEFERLCHASKRIFQVKTEEAKVFSRYPLFENTHFQLTDLRKKISGGAGIWLVRLEKWKLEKGNIFRENRLPFDRCGLMNRYWATRRMWDEVQFAEEIELLKPVCSARGIRDLRLWACRIKTGDLILATEGKNHLLGLGTVQSSPQTSDDAAFSSFRDVQWLKTFGDTPFILEGKVSSQGIARFRGSGLRLLQEVFENEQ